MSDPINRHCPRSGAPVKADSLTRYRDYTVGFCNPGCRDDFEHNGPRAAEDRRYFDVLIAERAGLGPDERVLKGLAEALPTLEGERIRLRAPRPADVDDLFALFGHAEVTRYWSHPPFQDRGQAEKLLQDILDGAVRGSFKQWAIALRADDRLIGTTTLFSRNFAHARAEVGYALRREFWGRGLATEALGRLIRHAEQDLGVLRLEADVDPGNAASLKMLERLGFAREGYARARWRVDGGVQDSVLLGRLAESG